MPTAIPFDPAEAPRVQAAQTLTPFTHHLRQSARIDCELVALKAKQLTQHERTAAAQAIACHDYARAFIFKLDSSPPRPLSKVLLSRRATALEKSGLLAALLRCCEIPARLRVYSVPGTHLRGLGDHGGKRLHPVVEAEIEGRWVATDTYHLDVDAALRARRLLMQERLPCGHGLYLRGASAWNGLSDATNVIASLSVDGDEVRDWGVFDDALDWQEASQPVHQFHKKSWTRNGFWN